jgi:hypothetical protein
MARILKNSKKDIIKKEIKGEKKRKEKQRKAI